MEITGGPVATRDCGGTSALLPAERARAEFDVAKLHAVLSGTAAEVADQHAKWHQLFTEPLFDFTYDLFDERKAGVLKSAERTIRAYHILKGNPDLMSTHMKYNLGKGGAGFHVGHAAQSSSSAAGNHFSIFLGAILARASDEQQREWVPKAINLEILGAYAQTELGHGSNVRALETTATFDETTDEFVVDSPTLTSMKWWPGCFGILATHAVVYARLLLGGKDHGIHEFMVQLRDHEHKPMPGIEVGDLGPKLGYNLVDNGYCRFNHVRIPRTHMLSRYQHVTRQGEFVKAARITKGDSATSDKLRYLVMITVRSGMVHSAAWGIAQAATVAIRYSAVRLQGFKNTRDDSLASGEYAVLDYQVQQYRLFKALATAYAFHFAYQQVKAKLNAFRASLEQGDVSTLAELHATAAGLKAFCTNQAGDLMEDCRRCCGGHGCLLSSGIAKAVSDFNAITPIAEGDQVILALQTARFLVRAVKDLAAGKPVALQVLYLGQQLERPDFSDLTDLARLVHAFKWRARRSVLSAAAKFEARLSAGESFDRAWNQCAVALMAAARDHCYLFILSEFVGGIEAIDDEPLKAVLRTLARHYALVNLRENGVDWAGELTFEHVQAINSAIDHTLAAIRPNAVALVDAFGISDRVLQSALGRYDGNVYEALYWCAKNSPLNEPQYIETLWSTQLSKVLNAEYIKRSAQTQRAGAIASKL